MKRYLTLLLMLSCTTAYCQPKTATTKQSQYSVNLTFTPQLFINGPNVANDGVGSETIYTKNTGGYRVGLELERKSRRNGFVMDIGLTYSRQHQYIKVYFDDPDSRIANALKFKGLNTLDFSTTSSYSDFHFTAGYVFPIKKTKGWNAVVKAGVSVRVYWNNKATNPYIDIGIQKNDTQVLGIRGINVSLGGGSWTSVPEMECNIGLMKNTTYKYLKNISFGIEVGRAIAFADDRSPTARAEIQSYYSYNNGNKSTFSVDNYFAKDLAIGLKLSAGLWHK